MKQKEVLVVGGALVIGVVMVVVTLMLSAWLRAGREAVIEKTGEELVGETEEGKEDEATEAEEPKEVIEVTEPEIVVSTPTTGNDTVNGNANLGNCTTGWGNLMLINPNFTVGTDFITARGKDLISVSTTYGIPEYNRSTNGDNLLMPEAARYLNEMIRAYEAAYPGHTMGTRSCFRVRGTNCGRLCAATGTSDHHTGLTCDLIDNAYGTSLDTAAYAQHVEWQWLKENSYKYGFIDRFPVAWAGGSMSAPINVDGNGTTGLYETWHYRYVGITAATEIATGKYNNGEYDSLEHYLKATGRVVDLENGVCAGE